MIDLDKYAEIKLPTGESLQINRDVYDQNETRLLRIFPRRDKNLSWDQSNSNNRMICHRILGVVSLTDHELDRNELLLRCAPDSSPLTFNKSLAVVVVYFPEYIRENGDHYTPRQKLLGLINNPALEEKK